ncbi:MAG: drug/metabolite transporter (DMT)-like permease [Candidatus Poriferisodalaceae bacterium]|jgi:drug/metabolite transporter (DMT)-like permease
MLMSLAMVGYVCNDAMIRLAVDDMPLYEAVTIRGAIITTFVGLWVKKLGIKMRFDLLRSPGMIARIGSEMLLTIVYLNALLRLELANITAIMQVMPLVVTFAAAMLLGEKVQWPRYVAIGVGFLGVLVIVRPASDGFNSWSALVLVAVLLLTIRDLATRWIPDDAPSLLLTWITGVSITLMGFTLSLGQGWEAPTARPLVLLAFASVFLVTGYFCSIQTVRVGDISASAPFRYTILIWGIVLGYFVFDETPDPATLIGAAIIVGASLYSLHRERQIAQRASIAT